MSRRATTRVREFLREALPGWVDEGLLSEAAANTLRERYALDALEGAGSRTLVTLLSVLGGALVGGGLILFVASNWSAIARPVRLGMLMLVLAALAESARRTASHPERHRPIVADGLLVATALGYGAAIALVAQTYHLSSYYPNGLLLWVVGLAPLAWVCRSRPMLMVLIAITAVRGVAEITDQEAWSWVSLALLVGFLAVALRGRSPVNAALAYYGIAVWVFLNLLRIKYLDDEWGVLLGIAAFAPTTLALAHVARERGLISEHVERRMLRFPVVKAVLIVLYVLSFRFALDDLAGDKSLGELSVFGGVVSALLCVAPLAAIAYLLRRDRSRAVELGETTAFAALAGLVVLVRPWLPGSALAWFALLNVVTLVYTISVVVMGLRQRDSQLAYIGGLGAAVLVITRFFDTAYDALPRSLAFLITGLFLLALGYGFERGRKRLKVIFHSAAEVHK